MMEGVNFVGSFLLYRKDRLRRSLAVCIEKISYAGSGKRQKYICLASKSCKT